MLGIEPILPGWEKFEIKPNLYDLEWCEGIVPSSKGDINVKIKKLVKNSLEVGFQIKAIIPINTVSIIYVPIQKTKPFIIEANKKEVWKNGQYLQNDSNISFQKKLDDHIVFEFKSGNYTVNTFIK